MTKQVYSKKVIDFVESLDKSYLAAIKKSVEDATFVLDNIYHVLAGDRNIELRMEMHEYLTGKKQNKTNSTASKLLNALREYFRKYDKYAPVKEKYYTYDSTQKKYILQEVEIVKLANDWLGILTFEKDYMYRVYEFSTGLLIAIKDDKHAAQELAYQKSLTFDKKIHYEKYLSKGFLSPNVEMQAKTLLEKYENDSQGLGSLGSISKINILFNNIAELQAKGLGCDKEEVRSVLQSEFFAIRNTNKANKKLFLGISKMGRFLAFEATNDEIYSKNLMLVTQLYQEHNEQIIKTIWC
jgi:hypothetical protein